MSTREPSAAAILAARIAKAYPSLSAYSAALLADELCRIERAQRQATLGLEASGGRESPVSETAA